MQPLAGRLPLERAMSVLPRQGILYLRARSRVESALLLRNFGAIDSVSFHPGVNMKLFYA